MRFNRLLDATVLVAIAILLVIVFPVKNVFSVKHAAPMLFKNAHIAVVINLVDPTKSFIVVHVRIEAGAYKMERKLFNGIRAHEVRVSESIEIWDALYLDIFCQIFGTQSGHLYPRRLEVMFAVLVGYSS